MLAGHCAVSAVAAPLGYYRQPAIHDKTVVFVAEGDLWKVAVGGGVATRLTTHPGQESLPAISADGQSVAFVAEYEGAAEVYTMPISGGQPRRWTFDAGRITTVRWTADGRLIAATDVYSTLPDPQLTIIDISNPAQPHRTLLPLAQASDGCHDDTGKTLYFTRLRFQGSQTKRYKGGTAQNLWRFTEGDAEATPLTPDYAGTSRSPMWHAARLYFATDRDGTMNLWSMKPDGADLRQHTKHAGMDVKSPSIGGGRIVYQLGADLRLYDIAADNDRAMSITLDTDFDQMRERWVKKPLDYLTSVHLSPDGDRVVLTARGRVYVAPHRQGRFVDVRPMVPERGDGSTAAPPSVRHRDARFMPDGKRLLTLSDESGEVEMWTLPANGIGESEQLTRDGAVLRWEALPAPDGAWIAHHDKNQRLFVYDTKTKADRLIDECEVDGFGDLAWSGDSKWLAYVAPAENAFRHIRLYSTASRKITRVTTDRFDSFSPAWSADGQWLYFLSDRNLRSLVGSPWGNYAPEPFLDKKTKIYALMLKSGLRSPWAPMDELHPKEKDEPKPATTQPATQPAATASSPAATTTAPAAAPPAATAPAATSPAAKPAAPDVTIELDGIAARIVEVPIAPGNYGNLSMNDKGLFWTTSPTGEGKTSLSAAAFARENVDVKTVCADIRGYELSADGKKLLIRKGDDLHITDATIAPADLDKKNVNLGAWTLSVIPREEWRQMFIEAWRLERDYFYDRAMHGVDWPAMRQKYLPLVDRVASREDLADLIAQMVSELSALHIFVNGGDFRPVPDQVGLSSLGALLERDVPGGGYRVRRMYQCDPDLPERLGPLARHGVDVRQNDLIESVNGMPALSAPDIGLLLRQRAGQQVLLRVRPAAGGDARDVIVTPLGTGDAADLRYHDWEYSRRQRVDDLGQGDIGYVHLRAMGNDNYTEWARNFYPVFTRKGLVIDVRHNRGGNIDSWIIGRLLRKAWFYWSQRVGQSPNWNMQYAFRGHVAVLCDESTASDGEAFTEGVKRLGLGRVFGTRTWGGEIWLTSSNVLVDRGIATAAEFGVYGPEGAWLIEGHGVEPDVVVDNLPHATFNGGDAQLDAAVTYLRQQIRDKPVDTPRPPRHPDKSK